MEAGFLVDRASAQIGSWNPTALRRVLCPSFSLSSEPLQARITPGHAIACSSASASKLARALQALAQRSVENVMPRFVLSPGDDRFPGEDENGGNDVVLGRGGDDLIFGGRGNDDLRGNYGRDDLRGGSGNDVLRGGRGVDRRDGGGKDTLLGDGGDDVLAGGPGINILTGGVGADRFIVESNPLPLDNRSDTILDFSEAQGDTIQINGFDLDDFREFRQRSDDSQDVNGNGVNDTIVHLNFGETLVIFDASLAELRGDVLFG
jgi:Ca2+-binding RTX toxin-like protein